MNAQTAFHTITSAGLAAMTFPPLSPEPARPPTWDELVQVEPSFAEVERMALALHSARSDVRDWGWIKRAFLPLVGFEARQYELRNSACYDVAYDHLLHCWEDGRRP